MSKKIVFRVRGTKFNPRTNKIPRRVQMIIDFLTEQKDGDLFPTRDLAFALNVTPAGMGEHTAHPLLADYREVDEEHPSRQILWGNQRTIAEFRKVKNGKD